MILFHSLEQQTIVKIYSLIASYKYSVDKISGDNVY